MPLDEIAHNLVCITIDVEWASLEVLTDMRRLLDERGLRATFFCTHAGINVPGHERALHPNFRRNGDTLQRLRQQIGMDINNWTDTAVYQHVIQTTHIFCPEAVGIRAHSLFYDSDLLPVYRQIGLEYDSTYYLPMMPGLRPVWKEHGMLEIPIYYMDHLDLVEQATGFRVEGLCLDQPGTKVFDFHPNMVFINASTNEQYLDSKPHHHHPDHLLALRDQGRGVRTLFLELLDFIVARRLPSMTLGALNTMWRTTKKQV